LFGGVIEIEILHLRRVDGNAFSLDIAPSFISTTLINIIEPKMEGINVYQTIIATVTETKVECPFTVKLWFSRYFFINVELAKLFFVFVRTVIFCMVLRSRVDSDDQIKLFTVLLADLLKTQLTTFVQRALFAPCPIVEL